MTRLLLWGATGLFLLRVAAQLVQRLAPQDFLPPFSQFHGGVLPYPLLLASQLLILGLMIFLNTRIQSGWRPHPRATRWLIGFAAVYFSAMLFRFVAGVFGWIGHEWFHRPIPALFHMVLATYVLALGCPARRPTERVAR